MAKVINEISELIESCRGREVLMEALCQSAKLVAGYQMKRRPDLSHQCFNVCSEDSGEPPVLHYTLDCGLDDCEPDRITAVLAVMSNAVDLLFYPVDTIFWLAKHKVSDVRKQDSWRYVNSLLCMLSVYLHVVRTSRTFLKLSHQDVLSLARFSVDLLHTICILPKGYLWGMKHSSLYLGAISAGLGICQILTETRLTKWKVLPLRPIFGE
ncbi:uncharacterized protein LOC6542511 [Drosophila erecta]|uniref:Peroxisomal membrane protein 11C n=1 Tax=Drosophila erecta TaxID=7220 RepID=B3N6E4_DROER|nr:uncharacterized protein LOC6542511 [Drosophila erecta]EDV58113.1 uncharacterized protein Dere_GG24164 [Drosophila erecta]